MRIYKQNGKTMMKNLSLNPRILFLLALMLVQLCLPMQAVHAATTATTEAYAVLSTDKKTLTFYYDTYKNSRVGTIYTSSNFRTSTSSGWGGSQSTITTVTFDSSFADYTSLTSTAYWFYGMRILTTINGLSYLKTNNVTNMSSMFAFCISLTSLNVSSFNTAKVTNMYDMFYNCQSLSSLDLSNFSTVNVTNMGWMFGGCKGLTNLDVSSFYTAKVTVMYYMFYNCESLTSLNLSTFSTANVTDMSRMFSGCKGLTNLNVSSFNTVKVTYMGAMFYNCSSLTSLDLSSFNTGMVQSMTSSSSSNNNTYYYGMFGNCSNLETIHVGSQWTTDAVTSSTEMFYNCTSLVGGDGTVYDPNYTDKTKAYAGIGGYLTMEGQEVGVKEAYAVLSTDKTTLTFYYDTYKNSRPGTVYTSSNFRTNSTNGWGDSASTITTVTFSSSFSSYTGLTSTAYWFYGMENLSAINGLNYLHTTNVTNMFYMFGCCRSLNSLDVSGFDTSKVTDMTGMFYGCSSLIDLDLSNFNTANVIYMNWRQEHNLLYFDVGHGMFAGCSSLKTINLSSFNTEQLESMAGMFMGCSSLTSLDLSNFNTANVSNMGAMFCGCSSLTSLDLSNFDTSQLQSTEFYPSLQNLQNPTEYGMFSGCSSLTSINLSSFNTGNITGMRYMFKDCSSLASLDLSNFNTVNVSNMASMFYGCSSLTSLDLDNFNTANVRDMRNMFSGCSNLASLDISSFNTANVTDMGGMFLGCSNLTSLDLDNFNTANVIYMSLMFSGCSKLQNLCVNGFNTENVFMMNGMFKDCISLVILDLHSFNTANVSTMGSGYNAYSREKSNSGDHKITIAGGYYDGVFQGCSNLKTIQVSDLWTTENVKYSSSRNMFEDCTSLVGGDGTTFDPNYISDTKAYAGRGGYLTLKLEDDLQYYLNSLTDTEDSFEDGVYTRQFQNWDWQALYVPFSMDYSDWQARFEVANIGQLSSEDGVYYLNASIMEEGSTVQPNTPYLIRAKAKAASKLKVTPDDVVDEEENVFALQSTQELGWLAASITGVYTTQPVWYSSNTCSDIYNYRMRGGALSIPESDEELLPPNRWYLTLDSRVQPSQVRVRIIDTETTAISDPVCQHDLVNTHVNYAIYDMQGRKVAAGSKATDRLRKGLYIINNKKRLVK